MCEVPPETAMTLSLAILLLCFRMHVLLDLVEKMR